MSLTTQLPPEFKMPYFSRLTDIVTCSLTEILDSSDDPQTTLKEVLEERFRTMLTYLQQDVIPSAIRKGG